MTAATVEVTGGVVAGADALAGRDEAGWPRVTVAILAFNRRDALRLTLTKTLTELDYPARALDVIVVDNASTDGSAEMVAAEFPSVGLIRMERNVGVAGINQAFAVAKGEWCLSLDDDCWIDGPLLKLAVAAAEANRADLASFLVRSGPQADSYFNQAYTMGLFGFWGCAVLLSRRALEQLGGYDPHIFIYGNEVEFTMRLLDAGLRHLYLPEVVAVHMKPTPDEDAQLRAYATNLRHWSYTAAKLLRLPDALRVIGRLTTAILLDVVAKTPHAATSLPAVLAGARDGWRVRRPVRAEVSAIYRDHFVSFANPVTFLRTPRQRWRARRDPSHRRDDAESRLDAFRQARGTYYPTTSAGVLEI